MSNLRLDPTILNTRPLKRLGWDHDAVEPWVWGEYRLGHVVEVLSFAIPAADAAGTIDERATIMVRMVPGDPTTLKEVALKDVACFEQTRHPWGLRPMYVYGDGNNAFYFTDDGPHGQPKLAGKTNRNGR